LISLKVEAFSVSQMVTKLYVMNVKMERGSSTGMYSNEEYNFKADANFTVRHVY